MHLSVEEIKNLLPFIPLLPLLGAAINGILGQRLPRPLVGGIACGSVLGSFVLALAAFGVMLQHDDIASLSNTMYTWMSAPGLHLEVRFVVDHLSGIMTLVITGIGLLIHIYSLGYMSHEPAFWRYFAYLNLFTFAMLVLVLGDSLPLMFVGWEGVGLCSYLLIGFWYTDMDKAIAGKKAFVVNRIGDFGFICAMLLLFRFAGTLNFPNLQTAVATGQINETVATAACLLMLLGATGKSAQLPLYVWLPDAMAGPTPVSALIHAATMVTAGVYMTARMGFMFGAAPIAMMAVAIVGALTALFAATIGTAQNDIKKVLAYSTVSQLGFMFIAAGVGAYAIAIFHVVTHAFFKACLFLGSGSVIHGMSGEQDMRQMGGLWRKMPVTFATFLIATLAITGFPLMAGFISKDAILWNAYASSHGHYGPIFETLSVVLWGMGVIAAGFTAFYMWRLVFMTFFSGKLRAAPEVAHHVHESPWVMTVPLMILAFMSLVGGALGWPHVLGGHEWIVEWLSPVVGFSPAPEGDHAAVEVMLMLVSTAIAFGGFFIAYKLYARQIHPFTRQFASSRPWAWIYDRVLNKWHVDELYDVVVVQPIGWVSRVVFYQGLDRRVIDGTVNAVGWIARSVGFLVQLFQNGNIQRYLAIFAVGLALLLWGWFSPMGSQSESGYSSAVMERPAPGMGEMP